MHNSKGAVAVAAAASLRAVQLRAIVFFAAVATVLAVAIGFAASVRAQDKQDGPAFLQIALTEPQVQGYLKVAAKLGKIFERLDAAEGKPDKKLKGDLETLSKSGGFKSLQDMEDVIANITFVMSGIDADTGNFDEPSELLAAELKEIEADKEIKGEERKQMIASIKDSIARTPKLKFPENVTLVKKHLKQLSGYFQDEGQGSQDGQKDKK